MKWGIGGRKTALMLKGTGLDKSAVFSDIRSAAPAHGGIGPPAPARPCSGGSDTSGRSQLIFECSRCAQHTSVRAGTRNWVCMACKEPNSVSLMVPLSSSQSIELSNSLRKGLSFSGGLMLVCMAVLIADLLLMWQGVPGRIFAATRSPWLFQYVPIPVAFLDGALALHCSHLGFVRHRQKGLGGRCGGWCGTGNCLPCSGSNCGINLFLDMAVLVSSSIALLVTACNKRCPLSLLNGAFQYQCPTFHNPIVMGVALLALAGVWSAACFKLVLSFRVIRYFKTDWRFSLH
ncbi:unnamed protein product [Chrysoparadoxa australica]